MLMRLGVISAHRGYVAVGTLRGRRVRIIIGNVGAFVSDVMWRNMSIIEER